MELRRQALTVLHLLSATVRRVAVLAQAAAGEERPGMARLEDAVGGDVDHDPTTTRATFPVLPPLDQPIPVCRGRRIAVGFAVY